MAITEVPKPTSKIFIDPAYSRNGCLRLNEGYLFTNMKNKSKGRILYGNMGNYTSKESCYTDALREYIDAWKKDPTVFISLNTDVDVATCMEDKYRGGIRYAVQNNRDGRHP